MLAQQNLRAEARDPKFELIRGREKAFTLPVQKERMSRENLGLKW